jgi:hypothetical protein
MDAFIGASAGGYRIQFSSGDVRRDDARAWQTICRALAHSTKLTDLLHDQPRETIDERPASTGQVGFGPIVERHNESVSRLRFSGTFDANDPRSLAILLDRDPELTVVKDADEWVITRR